eukprot:3941675-Rhodomonas_salina.2
MLSPLSYYAYSLLSLLILLYLPRIHQPKSHARDRVPRTTCPVLFKFKFLCLISALFFYQFGLYTIMSLTWDNVRTAPLPPRTRRHVTARLQLPLREKEREEERKREGEMRWHCTLRASLSPSPTLSHPPILAGHRTPEQEEEQEQKEEQEQEERGSGKACG